MSPHCRRMTKNEYYSSEKLNILHNYTAENTKYIYLPHWTSKQVFCFFHHQTCKVDNGSSIAGETMEYFNPKPINIKHSLFNIETI